jgi:hypothetical protein
VSTARPGLDQDDLLAIMTIAQRNNQRFGITGLMVFNGFNFMQYIEGDRTAANDRLHRIGQDDRHSDMKILSHREMPGRQFAKWDMASQNLPVESDLAQASLTDILSGDAVADTTRTFFKSFRSVPKHMPDMFAK